MQNTDSEKPAANSTTNEPSQPAEPADKPDKGASIDLDRRPDKSHW